MNPPIRPVAGFHTSYDPATASQPCRPPRFLALRPLSPLARGEGVTRWVGGGYGQATVRQSNVSPRGHSRFGQRSRYAGAGWS